MNDVILFRIMEIAVIAWCSTGVALSIYDTIYARMRMREWRQRKNP